jgi:hypothetical protein
MGLSDEIKVFPIRQRSVDQFNDDIEICLLTRPDNRTPAYKTLDSYIAELRIMVKFEASNASFDVEVEEAKKSLYHFLYRDVFDGLRSIKRAVHGSSRDKVLQKIDTLLKVLNLQ